MPQQAGSPALQRLRESTLSPALERLQENSTSPALERLQESTPLHPSEQLAIGRFAADQPEKRPGPLEIDYDFTSPDRIEATKDLLAFNPLAPDPRRALSVTGRGARTISDLSLAAHRTIADLWNSAADDPIAAVAIAIKSADFVRRAGGGELPRDAAEGQIRGAVGEAAATIPMDYLRILTQPGQRLEEEGPLFPLLDAADLIMVAAGGLGLAGGAWAMARRSKLAKEAFEEAMQQMVKASAEESAAKLAKQAARAEKSASRAATETTGNLDLADDGIDRIRRFQQGMEEDIKAATPPAVRSQQEQAQAQIRELAQEARAEQVRSGELVDPEIRTKLRSKLKSYGVSDDVTDEALHVLGEMQTARRAVDEVVDVSMEEAIHREVTGLSREFLEQSGTAFGKDLPPQLRYRMAPKGTGRAGISELEDVLSREIGDVPVADRFTESDIIDVLLGPTPGSKGTYFPQYRDNPTLYQGRVAEALEQMGFADNADDAMELAQMFDPGHPQAVINRLKAGPWKVKPGGKRNGKVVPDGVPNQGWHDMVEYLDARASANRAIIEADVAVWESFALADMPTGAKVGFSAAEDATSAAWREQFMRAAAPATVREVDAIAGIVDGNYAGSVLAHARGRLKPPVSAATGSERTARKLVDRLADMVDKKVVTEADLEMISMGVHGERTLPTDPNQLRAIAEYVDSIRSGRHMAPMNATDVAEMKKWFGRRSMDHAPDSPGLDWKHGAPKQGMDLVEDAVGAAPADRFNRYIKDVGLSGLWRDFDKTVTEAAEILRPALEGMHESIRTYSEKYEVLTKGIKQGSKMDLEIAHLLNGDFGDMNVLAKAKKLPVDKRSLDIAMEARRDLDDLFDQLKVPIPDLNYNKSYVTFIRDEYANKDGGLMPPTILKYADRKASFRFLKRVDGTVPDNLSFIESMSVYVPAALKKIHMQPAYDDIAVLKRQMGESKAFNKIALIDLWIDRFEGRQTGAERWLDTTITRVGEGIGLDVGTRPTMRASMLLATGFYRGILGANISAAMGNMTQTVNTMAKAGFFPTMEGIGRFVANETTVKIRNGLRHAGLSGTALEESAAKQARLQREFTAMFEENRSHKSKLGRTLPLSRMVTPSGHGFSFDDVIFAPFNFAEYMNRGIAYHVGIADNLSKRGVGTMADLRRTQGQGAVDDVIEKARVLSQNTQFMYDELGRTPYLRGPISRQFGVLVSFPIKQSEFLKELTQDTLRGESLGIIRYFAVTGYASYMLEEKLGVEMNAFRPQQLPIVGDTGLRGLEFLGSLENAPIGMSPFGQAMSVANDALHSIAEGEPEQAINGIGRMLDSFTNAIFAAAATKELIGAAQNAAAQVRRRRSGNIPGLREAGPELFQQIEDVTGAPVGGLASAEIPGIPGGTTSNMVAPVGDVMEETTAGREFLRLAGFTPVQAAETREVTSALMRFLSQRRGGGGGGGSGVARANDIGGFLVREGERERAREVLREVGASESGFERSFAQGELTQIERVWGIFSKGTGGGSNEQAMFLAEHPEMKEPLKRALRSAAQMRSDRRGGNR